MFISVWQGLVNNLHHVKYIICNSSSLAFENSPGFLIMFWFCDRVLWLENIYSTCAIYSNYSFVLDIYLCIYLCSISEYTYNLQCRNKLEQSFADCRNSIANTYRLIFLLTPLLSCTALLLWLINVTNFQSAWP